MEIQKLLQDRIKEIKKIINSGVPEKEFIFLETLLILNKRILKYLRG